MKIRKKGIAWDHEWLLLSNRIRSLYIYIYIYIYKMMFYSFYSHCRLSVLHGFFMPVQQITIWYFSFLKFLTTSFSINLMVSLFIVCLLLHCYFYQNFVCNLKYDFQFWWLELNFLQDFIEWQLVEFSLEKF